MIRLYHYLFGSILFIPLTIEAIAQSDDAVKSESARNQIEIKLPLETNTSAINQSTSEHKENRSWGKFRTEHPSWKVLWNNATGSPHRAVGNPIQIPGYNKITKKNIEQAAARFLALYHLPLKIKLNEIKFINASNVNNIWYVKYIQVKNSIEVLLSEIELRISETGNVFMVGVDFYNFQEDYSVELGISQVESNAVNELMDYVNVTNSTTSQQPYYLPVVTRDGLHFGMHKVYETHIESANESYISYSDVISRKTLWRRVLTRHSTSTGLVNGRIQEKLASDPFVLDRMAHQTIKIGSDEMVTDTSGKFDISINNVETLSTTLSGPWATIFRKDGPNSIIEMEISPGEDLTIEWNDSNSTPAERNAFYHINEAHDTLKAIDPDFTGLDFSIWVNVNINPSTCNAWYNRLSETINFDLAGTSCVSGANISSVVFHEYAHAIVDKVYVSQGIPSGQSAVNRAADEAQADVFACMIVDTPIFANGFFGVGTSTRNLATIKRYPQDVVPSSSHLTGLILGGAFWDLKTRTSNELVNRLAHFAKYGTPDDPDVGTSFKEWFLEVLIADDDDGDLSNGTPHFEEINWAFQRHGINVNGILAPNGIGNHLIAENIKIYPNPSKGIFQLDLGILKNENPVLEIYDTSGKLIQAYSRRSGFVGNYKETLDLRPYMLSESTKLLYLVIRFGDVVVTEKLIISPHG